MNLNKTKKKKWEKKEKKYKIYCVINISVIYFNQTTKGRNFSYSIFIDGVKKGGKSLFFVSFRFYFLFLSPVYL